MKPDPSLLDHLLSVMPEQDAFDVHLWAQYPWAVRLLMRGDAEWFTDSGDGGCSSCKVSWSEWEDDRTHNAGCEYILALAVLKDKRLEDELERAEKYALQLYQEEQAAAAAEERDRDRTAHEHFADATTRELRWEEQNSDDNGVFRPGPYADADY